MSTESSKIKNRVAVEESADETTQNIQLALPHAPTVLIVDDDHLSDRYSR